MRIYRKNTEDRKTISKRIAELTGEKLKYTMPACTFVGQGFTILRDGTLEAEETADEGVIKALIEEGLILPCESEENAMEADAGGQESIEYSEAQQQAGAEEASVTETSEESADDGESEDSSLTISLPLTGHTGISLRNLISMVYSRGRLISKATGGNFSCSGALVDHLKDDKLCITAESFIKAVADFEEENGKALTGLSFTDEKVNFTGFPFTDDAEKVQAFQQLACQMNRLAREQKRTLAKGVDESNEKYIFRIWLLRLGMAGDEFKTARKVLLAPLSGNAAFKDQAMEDRWKEKQNAKRDALKESREETEVAGDEISE